MGEEDTKTGGQSIHMSRGLWCGPKQLSRRSVHRLCMVQDAYASCKRSQTGVKIFSEGLKKEKIESQRLPKPSKMPAQTMRCIRSVEMGETS